MRYDNRQGWALALLVICAWVQDHRTVLGYLFLIGIALACDVGLFWLALQSAKVGPA